MAKTEHSWVPHKTLYMTDVCERCALLRNRTTGESRDEIWVTEYFRELPSGKFKVTKQAPPCMPAQ